MYFLVVTVSLVLPLSRTIWTAEFDWGNLFLLTLYNDNSILVTYISLLYIIQERVQQGKTPHYFPTRYGKVAGLKKKVNTSDTVLSFETPELHVSLVTLQLSADDVILVYNRWEVREHEEHTRNSGLWQSYKTSDSEFMIKAILLYD